MSTKTNTQNELDRLDSQISDLLKLVQQLKEENTSLRHQQVTLHHERAQLVEKNEIAKSRVEAIISRLKSLEVIE
ncbi:MAG: TIGR02449 family protein [Pseudomonadota bacterium]